MSHHIHTWKEFLYFEDGQVHNILLDKTSHLVDSRRCWMVYQTSKYVLNFPITGGGRDDHLWGFCRSRDETKLVMLQHRLHLPWPSSSFSSYLSSFTPFWGGKYLHTSISLYLCQWSHSPLSEKRFEIETHVACVVGFSRWSWGEKKRPSPPDAVSIVGTPDENTTATLLCT